MNYRSAIMASVMVSAFTAGAEVSFNGLGKPAIEIAPEKSTGLDRIFVLYDMNGASVSYGAQAASRPVWYRYSNLGGGYAERLDNVSYNGNVSTLANPEGDMGYIIEDGDDRYYFWITDYSRHMFRLSSVSPSDQQECDNTVLNVTGSGDAIHYYTINGRQAVLDREITVSYNTLEWDEDAFAYRQVAAVSAFDSMGDRLILTSPALCNTSFTVSGDRFLREWGDECHAESGAFQPVAVECHTRAMPEDSGDEGDEEEEASNVIRGDEGTLGGSAPARIIFEAAVTDAVIHNEWQIADDPDFEYITHRLTEQTLDYTFYDEGTQYVRYVGSNSDGSCETFGDAYTVSIGSSVLKCPNAFSPGASEGVNDIWKVAYRSLIDFECWIFDRYGNKMFHFTDPSQGWDGKYKGRLVKPGVYYYVIKATGADGKKYKKSGDINIIRFKGLSGSSSVPDAGSDSE